MKIKGRIGAHTSMAGGRWKALLKGVEIGADTIQLFTANQRRWEVPPIAQAEVERFWNTKEETGLDDLMSHASYLLNLGSPDPLGLAKSREAFQNEIQRCQQLGISYLNFHPGAALKGERTDCLDRIVASLLMMEPLLASGGLRLLIEMTAGQGSLVGCRFEELAYIIQRTVDRIPIGVCIDTCHLFAAGYDIRTPASWDHTLSQFDKIVGRDHLYAFHLNDSQHPLGSRKDRHAPLGEGHIGLPAFEYLMRTPTTASLPKYLETPGGGPIWEKEITWLREVT